MAITAEQQTEILEVVTGLFNAPPGATYMTELANLVESGMTKEQLADFLDDTSVFRDEVLVGKVTVEDRANILMDNFGLVADSDPASAGSQANAYFVDKLTQGQSFGEIVTDAIAYLKGTPAPEFADTAALLANKVQVAKLYSLNNSSTDFAELQSVLAGVSASFPATEAEANEYLDSIGQGNNPGSDFNLTFGADTITGGAGDDTFTAGTVNNGAGALVNSLEDVDSIDGSGGKDTLNALLNAAGTTTPALAGVEIINIRNVTAGAVVDFSDTTGAQQIWNNATTAALTLEYDAAPIAATFGVRNTRSTTDIDTFDDVTGSEDNLSLAVAGAGNDTDNADIESTTDAGSIETMSIVATGENFVDVSDFNAITALTVTGAGALTAVVDTTALEEVDASGNSGGVTLDLSTAANDLTVTGGSGNDDITAGTGDDTIDTGAGDDRVAFAALGLDDADTVEGGEGEDTLAFDDGFDADVAGGLIDSTVHTGFEVIELGAASAATTFDNDDFGLTKVVLAADLGQDLTLDNLGDGTLEVKDNQAGVITVSSTGTADTLNLSVNAEEAVPTVTLASLDITDVETVNVSTAADTDDTTFTTIETDGVTGLTFAGAGDVIISDITDGDALNNATTKITNIDLTGQIGGFEMTVNNLGYGTTFTLANLGETATATYDFDDVGGTDEASQLFGTAGFRDRFEFTTEFAGDVAIDDVEVGGDVSDDKIDLSFFGLASDDDLTITDVAAGVLVENDTFGGGRILLVGINSTDLNASDFVF